MAFYKTINKMQSEKKLLNKSKIWIILHLFLSAREFLLVFTNFVVVLIKIHLFSFILFFN